MFRMFYLSCLFLLAGSLFAADPFVGTWKLNVAQSKHVGGGNPTPKEATLVIERAGDQATVTITGTAGDGSPFSVKYTVPSTGGPLQYLEGGPPAGSGITSILAKGKAGSGIADFTDTKDGKVIESTHSVVSADGKSIRSTIKGIDPQGKKYEDVVVYDKQ